MSDDDLSCEEITSPFDVFTSGQTLITDFFPVIKKKLCFLKHFKPFTFVVSGVTKIVKKPSRALCQSFIDEIFPVL